MPRMGLKHSPESIEKMSILDARQRSEVIELYRSGLTGAEIARRIGIGCDPVYYWLKKSNIEMRKCGHRCGRPSWNKGQSLSPEQKSRLDMSGLLKGRAWNRGLSGHLSEDALRKMSEAHAGKIRELSSHWKGGISFTNERKSN
jgi:hypothetical protein